MDDKGLEKSDFVVCVKVKGSPAYFKDDTIASCFKCGEKIKHRPSMPKEPKKVCEECFIKILNI